MYNHITKTDKSHEEWLMFVNDKFAIENLKMEQNQKRSEIKRFISVAENNPDRGKKYFLKWIYKITSGQFFINFIPEISRFYLLKRNLKVRMIVGYCQPEENLKEYYDGYERVIDLMNINSSEKGEGYKAFKKLSEFTDSIKIPISLWTEKENNVPIFERYGFINKGRVGINNEFLMIRYPER